MQVLAAADHSQVGEIRRAASALAEQMAFSPSEVGAVALVATELATNIIKHARSGEIFLSSYGDGEERGIELIAVDRGPGIGDVALSLRDGYSTSGTAGGGLGAIRRKTSEFEIYSAPGKGTAVLARLSGRRSRAEASQTIWCGISTPKDGETVCGDIWRLRRTANGVDVMVADGLGHGPLAAAAAQEAARIFERPTSALPQHLVGQLHDGLRPTRGAAVAIASLDVVRGSVVFCGIGNIAGSLHSASGTKKMVSLNGTAGHVARKIAPFDYPFEPRSRATLILHSDGISASFSLEAYPNLVRAHPALIAAVLHRDFRRNDDATVLVLRTMAA